MKKHAGNFFYGLLGVAALAFAAGCSDDPPGGNNNNNNTGGSGNSSGTGTELLTTDAKAEGWIGGDPATAEDNPGGVQGALYIYGDEMSCTVTMGNPCTADGCCLSGHTIVDDTFAAWGCGIGLSLNDTGGDASMKLPFAGGANVKFSYTITGTTGGNELRVGFTQFADTTGLVSPYKPIAAFEDGSSGTIGFGDAVYPSWCSSSPDCLAPPDRTPAVAGSGAKPEFSHDIQFQIAGGERDGDFNFCITSLQVSE